MSYQISCSSTKLDKAMSPEQFTQVVDAILAGKYSWACVLILRFAGYNPLHYIPYRTYNRLLKENNQVRSSTKQVTTDNISSLSKVSESECKSIATAEGVSKVKDLAYLETAKEPPLATIGGDRAQIPISTDPVLSEFRQYLIGY